MEREKYDKIGVGYNNTRKADPYICQSLIYHLNGQQDQSFLDIGCGSGNYTSAFIKAGLNFIGMDPSEHMLRQAQRNCPEGIWKQGRAENTGFDEDFFDGIVGSLTIHHWQNLDDAFRELYRVMRPNGDLVLFTSTPDQMKGYWLNAYFPKMLSDSMIQMPRLELITQSLTNAGFKIDAIEKYFVTSELQDLFLYSGKQRPSLYLDPEVRHGISSFSDLANQKEVTAGIKQLAADIDNHEIQNVMSRYENDLGDYLFVKAQKN
ncbi:MAG: class I SAM-dependent methyltransferase [Reichenbachiella sp.]|uniref:class I SAM-dependent methyltransferase n=1 Tax=Reichenbachiella sp. TaxID=2184521 RepID=UPI00326657F9